MNSNSQGPALSRNSPQQLVTRHNAVLFYGIAAAALLETEAARHARGLAAAFEKDAAFCAWVEDAWIPAKSGHAERSRAYVDAAWPEFDWRAACDGFSADYRRLAPGSRPGQSIAYSALACSMAAAQAAMFYRALGGVADDAELRRLLHAMAADEVAHFECFRQCYEDHRRREHLGMLASFRAVLACALRARDLDVRLAFDHLRAQHWYGGVPLQDLSYREFVERVGNIVRRQLPLGPAQRLLFKPWLTPHDVPADAPPPQRTSRVRQPDADRLAARAQSR